MNIWSMFTPLHILKNIIEIFLPFQYNFKIITNIMGNYIVYQKVM